MGSRIQRKPGVRTRGGYVPKTIIRFASQFLAKILRRMHLKRQLLLRIEKFEARKPSSVRTTKDFLTLASTISANFFRTAAASHDLCASRTERQFPMIHRQASRRKLFVKFGFRGAARPTLLDKNGWKVRGNSGLRSSTGRGKRPMSNVQSPISQFRTYMQNLLCY